MRPISLDTNAYSDFMQGVADIVEIIALADRIGLETGFLRQLWVFNGDLVKKPGFWIKKHKTAWN